MAYHNGQRFSTLDQDNDSSSGSCSQTHGGGGWWYKSCDHADLNGWYGQGRGDKGIEWAHWKGSSFRASRILIRPVHRRTGR